ncbi:MAG: N-acetyl-gamma-glutamyl-phosphate reductase [Firmicutes bacterium]|nr:N-acetyl-gamma-glutamyl-phosphate reductase [Bacillota bacterium]
MVRVTIIGASGYAGAELIRILANHKNCKIVHLVAKGSGGKTLGEIFPALGYLADLQDMVVEDVDNESLMADCAFIDEADVVFTALPHGASAPFIRRCMEKNIKAVDLGADFRFRDVDTYEEWYGKHTYPEICKDTVYGLVEVKREQIKGQQFIANPGCYVTGATLAMYPLVKEGLVDLNTLIFDSKSGISGAGRGAREAFLYGECSESIKAYGVANHRHTPEIEQNLGEAAGQAVTINFTPHLTPMNRGILTTAYATLNEKGKEADLAEVFKKYYGDEHFIKVLPQGKMPETKWIQGTNFVVIGFTTDPRTGRVIVCSVLDNLVKGAAGQAVQNMNLMCGFDEAEGLNMLPVYP